MPNGASLSAARPRQSPARGPQWALGLVETRGLVAAIEAADAMLKAAAVRLVGKEVTKGAIVTIMIAGETGAVQSSVAAGGAAAEMVGELISTHIIPRPHDQIQDILIQGGSPEAEPGGERASPEDLSGLTVRQLRELARKTPGLKLQGRDISRANKQDLVAHLREAL